MAKEKQEKSNTSTETKVQTSSESLTEGQKALARYLYFQGEDPEQAVEKAQDLTKTEKTKKL